MQYTAKPVKGVQKILQHCYTCDSHNNSWVEIILIANESTGAHRLQMCKIHTISIKSEIYEQVFQEGPFYAQFPPHFCIYF